MTRNFIIPKPDNILIGIDFGKGDDVAVKIVYKRLNNGLFMVLSREVIGKAKDYDTEEKINQYIKKI